MVKRMDLLTKVRPFVGLDVVKVLTGLRRSGKSVLMRQIQDMILSEIDPAGKLVYVNLEEDENKKFIPKGILHDHVAKTADGNKPAKTYVFLDEISDVEEWDRVDFSDSGIVHRYLPDFLLGAT